MFNKKLQSVMYKTHIGNFRKAIMYHDVHTMKVILDSVENEYHKLYILNSNIKIPTLFLALNTCQPDILKFLFENGIDINIKCESKTPLMNEIKHGNFENFSMLMKYGCDMYIKDDNGNDALYYARYYNRLKIFKKLNKKHSKNKTRLRKLLYNNCTSLDEYCIENIVKYIF